MRAPGPAAAIPACSARSVASIIATLSGGLASPTMKLMLGTALDAGVSPETLRKIESGRVATPAFPTIAAIADVLGLSLDELWAEISRPGRGAPPASSDHDTRERSVS